MICSVLVYVYIDKITIKVHTVHNNYSKVVLPKVNEVMLKTLLKVKLNGLEFVSSVLCVQSYTIHCLHYTRNKLKTFFLFTSLLTFVTWFKLLPMFVDFCNYGYPTICVKEYIICTIYHAHQITLSNDSIYCTSIMNNTASMLLNKNIH